MQLTFDASDRAAQIFLAFKRREGWTGEQFAARTGGAVGHKTLHRLLADGSPFGPARTEALATVLSAELNCSAQQILSYIMNGGDVPAALEDLTYGEFIALTERGLSQLDARLEACESRCLRQSILCTTPPLFLLTGPVRSKVCRHLAASLPGGQRYRAKLLSNLASRQHTRFWDELTANPRLTDVFVSAAELRRFLTQTLPGIGCTVEQIEHLLEFWIYDGLAEGRVRFGVVPDADLPHRDVPLAFDTLTLLDQEVSLRQRWDKPSVQWTQRRISDPRAGDALDRDAALLAAWRRAVPYDMDDHGLTESVLQSLYSPAFGRSEPADADCTSGKTECLPRPTEHHRLAVGHEKFMPHQLCSRFGAYLSHHGQHQQHPVLPRRHWPSVESIARWCRVVETAPDENFTSRTAMRAPAR